MARSNVAARMRALAPAASKTTPDPTSAPDQAREPRTQMAPETPQTPATPQLAPPSFEVGQRGTFRDMARSIAINGVLALLIYNFLKGRGASDIVALGAAAIPPALDGLFGVVRRRRVDLIGALVLAGLAISIVAVLIGGDPRMLLIRESFLTGALGIACFASLFFFSHPLMFYFGRYFMAGNDAAKAAWYNAQWQYADFRHANYVITLVWAIAYTGEFLLRVVVAYTLPVPVVLAISPLIFGAITAATIIWTFAYARQGRQRREQIRRAAGQQ